MRRVIVAAVAAVLAFGTPASAATLIGVSGQVLVNRGKGFELAENGLDLKPGDIVVANPGSTAQVIYPEGCLAPVTPGAIVAIPVNAPCAAPPVQTGALPALGLGPLLLGGGAAAGGIGLATALSKNGSKPASP